MNIPISIANILTLLAFVLHTFVGDKELKINEPNDVTDVNYKKREKWTMVRCGWHWVSFDLLFTTIGLGLINFTSYFDNEKILLQILTIYFLGYAIVWTLTVAITNSSEKLFKTWAMGFTLANKRTYLPRNKLKNYAKTFHFINILKWNNNSQKCKRR
jgi:hypothetical protein